MWKGGYCYQYTDDSEKFDKKTLTENEDFSSYLKMEDITGADYDEVSKDFEIKNLVDSHNLYVKAIHYCEQMYLKTFQRYILKYMNLILLVFFLKIEYGKQL